MPGLAQAGVPALSPWPAAARALTVAAVALLVATRLRPILRAGPARRLAWGLLLVPYLAPLALPGYAYAAVPWPVLHRPAGREALYLLLLAAHFTPLAAALLALARPALDGPARHCRRLAPAPRLTQRLGFALRGPLAPTLAAGALVALPVFAEFELASLLARESWSVALFDAQAGGLPVAESLRLALAPAACQIAVLAALLALLWNCRLPATADEPPVAHSAVWPGWAWLVLAALLAAGLPLALVLRDSAAGLRLLLDRFPIGRELAASLVLAAVATGLAYLAAGALLERRRWGAAATLCLPGLAGPLLLALLLLALAQHTLPDALLGSPLPLVVCLTLLLLPPALLLRLLTGALAHPSALHLARLAPRGPAARDLVWQLDRGRHFWALALLFGLAYFDLTASSILPPSGMTPVTVRLYNLMHYGQSAGLSALLLLGLALPWLAVGVGYGTRRIWARG